MNRLNILIRYLFNPMTSVDYYERFHFEKYALYRTMRLRGN